MITIQQAKQQLKTVLLNLYESREGNNIAQLLLEHITNFSATQQLVNNDLKFTNTQFEIFVDALEKLKQHTPIQQIIGYTWFDNEKYIVSKDVLIPRPETEELLQWIKQDVATANTIIDIGSGSGILALGLKKHFDKSQIHAIDISHKALFIAKQNAVSKKRIINWQELDFLNAATWNTLPNVDVIVSNPPYIKNIEAANMQPNVLQHEPHTALFVDDNNALIFYEAIANFAVEKLVSNGCIFVEINEALGKETCQVFESFGFKTKLKKDLQEKDRMIKAWRN